MRKEIKTDFKQNKQANENVNPIRPQDFSDYIGQSKVKEQVLTAVKSSIMRNVPVGHMLFYGPPGLGKTTIAHIIAKARGSKIKEVTGPMIEHSGEMASILTNLQNNEILFIDEIHRLDKKVEETLYSAMEDQKLNIVIGQGDQCKSITLDLPPFTLIGATTRAGMLSAPLRDRFSLLCKMEYYTIQELTEIGLITADKFNFNIAEKEVKKIAEVSRGTPRIMNSNLGLIRDFVIANNISSVSEDVLIKAFELYGIHEDGLTDVDIRILTILNESEKPIGLTTLSHIIGEDPETIENVCEPFLLMNHYIEKTTRGRVIAPNGKCVMDKID